MKRRKVYLTDRDDNGKLFGYLVAVDDEFVYDVELAPNLTVLSNDGLTRIPTRRRRDAMPDGGGE